MRNEEATTRSRRPIGEIGKTAETAATAQRCEWQIGANGRTVNRRMTNSESVKGLSIGSAN